MRMGSYDDGAWRLNFGVYVDVACFVGPSSAQSEEKDNVLERRRWSVKMDVYALSLFFAACRIGGHEDHLM